MSCTPFETLSAYADGGLPELESATVTGHLHACNACRARLDELRWLKEAVRSSAPAAVASEEFKARLAASAARSRRRRRDVRLAALAGAIGAALAVLLVILPLVRERRAMSELIGDHVDITVTREEAFDVTGTDPRELERSFTGKIDFPLHIPDLPRAKLVGARLCDIAGRHVPLASYELGPRRVSIFAERTNRRSRPMVCDEQVHGFTVCRQTVAGIEYLFVSDYPAPEAGGLLTAALGPAGRP
jgi:anti-sigma factor RsiW